MEKIKPILLAVFVGCACAFYLFKNVEKKAIVAPKYNAVAIQIGVFKDAENAEKMSDSYGGLVFKEEDLYRVYYSILNKDENIEYMTNYLTDKGINYYLKDLHVADDFLKSSSEYELAMTKTKGEGKLAINEEILNMYKEVV